MCGRDRNCSGPEGLTMRYPILIVAAMLALATPAVGDDAIVVTK